MGTPVKYGILGGFGVIALYMLAYLISSASIASIYTMFCYLPLMFCMIYGAIEYRTEIGGYENFGKAFLIVFLIGAIGAVMQSVFSVILFKYIDPSLPELVKQVALENTLDILEKVNAPQATIDESMAKARANDYNPSLLSFAYGIGISLVINTVLSLLIAAFVRRDSNAADPQNLYK
jgi:hypothetical protein